MPTTRAKLLERLAEVVLVLVILGVTGATWLPALIGADPDPSQRIARERADVLRKEQELRLRHGPGATPTTPPRVITPAPDSPSLTAPPSPVPPAPANTPAP